MGLPDDADVEAWLARLYAPGEVPDDELNADTLRWLRRYFDTHGAGPTDVVWDAMFAHRMELANEAVVAAQHDLHHATSLRPRVVVDTWEDQFVRISIDQSFRTPSMEALDQPAAFAEVADYFQERLDREAWPLCSRHDVGLHAEVHEGTAVWRCRLGNHTVAPIGALGD